MKKIAIAVAMVVCGLGVSSAYADGGIVGAPAQIAISGPYIIGDFGYGRLFTPNSELNPSVPGGSFNRDHIVWSGGLGYNFAMDSFNLFGVEADYDSNGQSSYTSGGTTNNGNLTMTSTSASLLLTYTTIWHNGVDLFFKVGGAYVWQTDDYSANTIVNGFVRSGSNTLTHFQPTGVIGVGYYVAHNLNLFADVTVLGGNTYQDWSNVTHSGNSSNDSNQSGALSAQAKLGLSYQF